MTQRIRQRRTKLIEALLARSVCLRDQSILIFTESPERIEADIEGRERETEGRMLECVTHRLQSLLRISTVCDADMQ